MFIVATEGIVFLDIIYPDIYNNNIIRSFYMRSLAFLYTINKNNNDWSHIDEIIIKIESKIIC